MLFLNRTSGSSHHCICNKRVIGLEADTLTCYGEIRIYHWHTTASFRDIHTPRQASRHQHRHNFIAQLSNPARQTSTCSPSFQYALRNNSKRPAIPEVPRREKCSIICAWWSDVCSFLCKIQKAAENHVSKWSDTGRSEDLELNPGHLQQRLLPVYPAVDKSQKRLGRKENYSTFHEGKQGNF